jgi:hypothetical protein
MLKKITIAAGVVLTVAACSSSSSAKDNNATACDFMRNNLSGLTTALDGLQKGTETNAEAATHIGHVAKDFSDQASYSTGDVRVGMQLMADDLGRWHVALLNGGDQTAATNAVLKDSDTWSNACKAIGH